MIYHSYNAILLANLYKDNDKYILNQVVEHIWDSRYSDHMYLQLPMHLVSIKLHLWVRLPLVARCIRYNIKFISYMR